MYIHIYIYIYIHIYIGTRLAFDPTPIVSHMTLPLFCGRVECEKSLV